MINIRQDLIEKELESDDFNYHKFNLHNSLISKLYNHYKLVELCENFYDNEPEFDDEEYNMYLDYNNIIEMTNLTFWNIISREDEIKKNKMFSINQHTKEELKEAYNSVMKKYKDYESHRVEFCNWQEPYSKGNWGMSQKYVDDLGRDTLKKIKRTSVSNKDRLYIGCKDNYIRIYFYGRDFMKMDYWFIYERR